MKKDQYYFDVLISCANYGCDAAKFLQETLKNFNPDSLTENMAAMHAIEHDADMLKHDMMERLGREFMTPIELEDLVALSQELDNVVDCIDDVMQRIYIHNVTAMRDDVPELAALLVRCAQALCGAVGELANFRKSETIRPAIVDVNSLESEADGLYLKAMRSHQLDAPLRWPGKLLRCLRACERCDRKRHHEKQLSLSKKWILKSNPPPRFAPAGDCREPAGIRTILSRLRRQLLSERSLFCYRFPKAPFGRGGGAERRQWRMQRGGSPMSKGAQGSRFCGNAARPLRIVGNPRDPDGGLP